MILLGFIAGSSANEIFCERIDDDNFWSLTKYRRTCYMDDKVSIDNIDTTIGLRDDSILSLRFFDNKKIKYLPVGVNGKFPNLINYAAGYCSLTVVYKANFRGMNKLELLDLNVNKIERIFSNTFEDLISLQKLFLGELKLKKFQILFYLFFPY